MQAEGTAPSAVSFANLWWQGRWLRDATVSIDSAGHCVGLSDEPPRGASSIGGLTLPGIVDAHCHAFQRALGPWTQRAASERDDFWSWREAMYALAGRLQRDDLEAISARCYLELLRGGYTRVAEFLYLHRLGRERQPDADLAIAAAAQRTGIGLTLLPTLYQHADFGGVPPRPGQLPFVRSTALFLEDWQTLRGRYPEGDPIALGVAFHSLRAVDVDVIASVVQSLQDDPMCRCLHIHVAEQPVEVASCVRQHGLPPVALLASRALLSARWALVHATHATGEELAQLRAAKATLVLCPTTEADLGDGCPDVASYLEAGGYISIGSDSNIARSALGELRQLEWSQRLARGRRNVLATAKAPAVADRLFQAVLTGGLRAIGVAVTGEAAAHPRADFVSYDLDAGDWALQRPEDFLSALVFDAAAPRAQQVMVGGRWVIRDGVHAHEATIEARYRETLRRLRALIREGTQYD
jgi:formimidoylglutamate deiminase